MKDISEIKKEVVEMCTSREECIRVLHKLEAELTGRRELQRNFLNQRAFFKVRVVCGVRNLDFRSAATAMESLLAEEAEKKTQDARIALLQEMLYYVGSRLMFDFPAPPPPKALTEDEKI